MAGPLIWSSESLERKVIYEISSARITVLAVLHGRRLLESVEDRLT